jgi:hypothetical protein
MGALISGNLTSLSTSPCKESNSRLQARSPPPRSHYNTSVQKNGSKRQRQFDFYYGFQLFAIFNLWKEEKISEIQSMGMGILLTDEEEHSLPRTNTLPHPETLT